MTATTVAGVGARIGASDNGVAAAVTRALADGQQPLGPVRAREVYRALPDRASPTAAELATARALLGRDGPALRCAVAAFGPGLAAQPAGSTGLTARAETLRQEMRATFGPQSLGG